MDAAPLPTALRTWLTWARVPEIGRARYRSSPDTTTPRACETSLGCTVVQLSVGNFDRSIEGRFPLVKHRGVRLEHVWHSGKNVEGHPHIVNGCTTGEPEGVAQEYSVSLTELTSIGGSPCRSPKMGLM